MRQAVHILKKDVRYLRWELVLVLAFMGMFVYAQVHPDESDNGSRDTIETILLACLWAFVCARLIQAETLPGDRQFWITRPYSWRSLLGAKLLFVMLFLSIPLLIADAVILAIERFSIAENLPGLLWLVLLVTAGGLVTLCAFAALMRGLAQWVISALLAVGGFVGLEEIGEGNDWGREEWMRRLGVVAMLFILASVVLLWQYKNRRTATSRVMMAMGLLAIWLCWDNAPPAIAFETQTALSKPKVDTSHIQIALRAQSTGDTLKPPSPSTTADDSKSVVPVGVPPENRSEPMPSSGETGGKTNYVSLPLDVSGLAKDMSLFVYHVRVTYELEGGPDAAATWSADEDVLEKLRLPVDSSFYSKSLVCLTTIRLKLYLTLLGNPVRKMIETGAGPSPVPGVGLCSVYNPGTEMIRCISPLREPSNLMTVQSGLQRYSWFFITENSYSPFPADLSVSPLRWYWHSEDSGWKDSGFTGHTLGTQVPGTLVTSVEPLAHFRRDLVLRHMYLSDPVLR